jgi:predicted transcriptional regulator YdeE
MDTAHAVEAPRIEKLAPFSVVGPRLHIADGDPTPIYKLWQGLGGMERPENFSGLWGVCWGSDEVGFHYMAAYVVPHGTKAPEGMEARTFPGLKYAVWPFKGSPPEMGKAFLDIFKNRMPAAGLKHTADNLCLEIYPDEPMDAEGNLIADLYVAVE